MKKAFTLVELIVVITILAILGTISFISLQGYSKDTRDVKRISDVRSLLSKVNIENTAGTPLSNLITNDETATGQILGIENTLFQTMGEINFININEKQEDFQDPTNKTNYPVAYAIGGTGSGAYNFTQIATISETQNTTKILGNYYTKETNDIPSLFTKDGENYYEEGKSPIYDVNNGSIPPIIPSCNETTKPTDNGNIIYTEGTPIEENQSWQNTNSNNACYYTCKPNYTGTNCNEEILNGACNITNTPTATAPTIENLCISGTSTIPQDNTTNWSWTCEGVNGGETKNCSRPKAYCSSTPTGTGIEETIVGTPTNTNQSWQNTDSNNACYYTCKENYSGTSCVVYTEPLGIKYSGTDIIVSDGAGNVYTLMDRNLGATTAYTAGAAESTAQKIGSSLFYGNYYQWGRNDTGFTTRSNPGYTWSEKAQGPCPTNYHVPSTLEWYGLFQAWCKYRKGNDTLCTIPVLGYKDWSVLSSGTEVTLINLKKDLKMPSAGDRYREGGTVYSQGTVGYYWSSSSNGSYAHNLDFTSVRVRTQYHYVRGNGFSIRCFKN